jgi:spectinomycin phosphotransferase
VDEDRRSTDAIARAAREAYGLDVTSCVFLPVGNDVHSWSFRLETSDGPYFLKTRTGEDPTRGALVTAYLAERGVPAVLAPLPTTDGEAFARLDGAALILYPMLDATVAAEMRMDAARWHTLGRAARRLHDLPPPDPSDLHVPTEPFRAWRRELIDPIEEALSRSEDPLSTRGAAVWRAHADEIADLVARTDAMADRLRERPLDPVLCHTDLHTWNVLIDGAGDLWLVDWEESMLAPRERDLMFVIGGGLGRGLVSEDDTAAFLDGYGSSPIDDELIAYFRLARAVEDLAADGEELVLLPGASGPDREAALRGLEVLFEPGAIVDLALAPFR